MANQKERETGKKVLTRQHIMLMFLLLVTIFIGCIKQEGKEVKLSKGEWILLEKEEPQLYVKLEICI